MMIMLPFKMFAEDLISECNCLYSKCYLKCVLDVVFLPLIIAIICYQTGKTSTAIGLAKYYEAALLTVDSIILEAISSGNTPAGLRARELCSLAAKAQLAREGEGSETHTAGAGGLSVEAVTAHSQGQAGGSGKYVVCTVNFSQC